MQIRTILDQIDLGSFALPEFQRGYVWNRDQVKGLVYSLYRRFPVGSLLTWVTTTEGAPARSGQVLSPGVVKLLLDGQQRVTTLYGLMRGHPPKFFQGNAQAFTGLYFNVETEAFEFYAATKMKDDPRWVSVTDLLQNNAAKAIRPFMGLPEFAGRLDTYLERLNALATIPDTRFHIEEVTGTDKTIDVVVEIFNRVNTGGTKLSKGDIALARVCSAWTGAREALRERLQRWARAGFSFELEWLLRSITAQETDTAYYDGLATLDVDDFKAGLERTEKSVDYLLNVIASRLGLDHDRVLGGVYAFPLMLRYLRQQGTTRLDPKQRDRLLYWYVHTFLWGRYSGSTETVLNKDLAAIRPPDGSLEQLIAQLRQNRGDLRLTAEDFAGWSRGARFYPLLYMMTRTCRAVDWGTGIELSMHLLGRSSRLHIHHVFPKNRLRRAKLSKADINAIANFTFLTQDTNIAISDRLPEEYLPEIAERYPNALHSHWIPADDALWKVGRYPEFLAARRELLAQAANRFLDELAGQAGAPAAEVPEVDVTTREVELCRRRDSLRR